MIVETSDNSSETINQQLSTLRELLETFMRPYTGQVSLQAIVDELNHQYTILEETLATILNWLALQKSIVRELGVVERFTGRHVENEPSDTLKRTIRMVILPQIETMIQNVYAAEKGAEKIIPLVERDLLDLKDKIRNIQELDQKLIRITEFDLDVNDGLVYEILTALYSSNFDLSREKLVKFAENIQKNLPR